MADNKTLTKKHLIKLVAKRTGITNKKASYIVDAVLISLVDLITALDDGERLEIRNFGVFSVKYYFPVNKKFHNPQTLEPVFVGAKKKLRFKPSAIIKKRLLKI